MPEGLKLIVSSDVQGAINDLKGFQSDITKIFNHIGGDLSTVNKQVAAFGGGVLKFIPPAVNEFKHITPAINNTIPAIKSFTKSTGAATTATINLGRVIQDAPFGFIGIANNINPLLESFQRLRKESVSTGAAFRSFGAALLGGGGLGLGISIITSLLTQNALAHRSNKEEVDKSQKTINEAVEKQKEFQQSVDKASQSIISQVKNIKDLRSILDSATKSTESLTKETINQGVARLIFDQKESELAKALSAEIEKQFLLRKRFGGLNAPNIVFDPDLEKLKKFQKSLLDLGQSDPDLNATIKRLEELNKITGQSGGTINFLNSLSGGLTKFFTEFIDGNKDADKEINKLISKAKALANELENVFVVPVFSAADSRDQTIAKARKFLDDFFNVRLEVIKIPIKVSMKDVEFPPDEVKTAAHSFEDMFSKELQKFNAGGVTDFTLIDAQTAEKQKKLIASIFGITPAGDSPFTKMQRESIAAAKAITDILTPAFQGLFSAILSGESPIKAFFQSLGQAVQQLIAKLVQAAIQALILSALFPGGVGGVKGFGKIFGNILGFAAGGIVSGPTIAMIGEGIGTSRSNPEVVAPLDQLKGMLEGMGGGRQVVVLETTLRGRDIRLGQARTSRSQRNTTGR